MIKITREDLIKLGHISNISISEEEIPALIDKLQAVLSYAANLKDIAAQQTGSSLPRNVNVMRPDEVQATPAEPLLALAPQREDQFFVVPVILKN